MEGWKDSGSGGYGDVINRLNFRLQTKAKLKLLLIRDSFGAKGVGAMPIENVTINRICLHEVYRRSDEGVVVRPTYGAGLLKLELDALAAFRSRVVAAFKSTAQCMEMIIREHGEGSVIAHGAHLITTQNPEFVKHSAVFADALATAQGSRQIPGGLMVIFDGTLGNPATPFFGVMKAELHEGFIKTADLQARFVSDLFLSPKTKLYKIGLFVSDGFDARPKLPDGWTVTVYDSAMTASQRDNAATYFHSTFLGLDIPDNSAQQVKKFFEQTRAFIKGANIAEEQKVDLYNGLYTYLKLDRGNTIQTARFAESFMDDVMSDEYLEHMRREKFPQGAIAKDLSEIAGVLRLRKFRFPRAITLSGPPDAVRDLVVVSAIKGEDGAAWTQITIRGQIEAQE
ncbi:nucleoid-associated protein [Neorhizobium sp. T6_25]|uniref:nucleoid-associated protein n=1 Tax=Neorhizobium sp. T6_25 TaxID=2093833 RepID=UPI001FE003CA|nr:nucleoid-associated protein [Neorhizobium sp. T6_25]